MFGSELLSSNQSTLLHKVNVSNANTNNQQHDHNKEAPLMSRDHKRPIAQAMTDSSPKRNQQQQHHIVTCFEMRDVWINEIGPKLGVIDIVKLSMVNQWARLIAHNIKQHNGYATVTSVSDYREGVVCWPDLRWELRLDAWSQDDTNHTALADSKWCDVVSLHLNWCVSDFSFVETRRLEEFSFTDYVFRKVVAVMDSVASMLVSCTRLVSLSLNDCIYWHGDVEWLVNVLAHHTHLTHLSLRGNHFRADRLKQVCGVLCHMSHITSLHLSMNDFGDEGVKCVCDSMDNMSNIKALNFSFNKIGPNGAKHVCAALANKHHMTELYLHHNELESEGVRHLLPCLTQLPKLSKLRIFQNCVDDKTIQQVRRQLPHVKEMLL